MVIVPSILLLVTGGPILPKTWGPIGFGMAFAFAGFMLMYWTIRFFYKYGEGTLAPWDPTQKLVVEGVYRHTRNPMITGVFCILLGESVLFHSTAILCWFAVFFVGNLIYIRQFEEPGLVQRFGEPYLEYKENVPRWIPRITRWRSKEVSA